MKMGRPPKRQGKVPHLEQKGNSLYHVTATGKRKWTKCGTIQDRAAALVRWAELEGKTNNGTFADIFRWFMANGDFSDNTRNSYETQGKWLLMEFGDAPPDQVQTSQIGAFKQLCVGKVKHEYNCGTGTCNVRLGLMQSVYSAAKEAGLCQTNPVRDVARFKQKRRTRYIDDAEFIAIRDKAEDFLRVAMNIAYQIGCRPSDVVKMRLADVTDEGVLIVAKKTKKKTLYSMDPELRSALDEAKALPRGVKSLYVLCNYRGQPYTVAQLRDAWIDACELAGVAGAQQRDIRAKNASDDPDGAQGRLQHSDKRTTQIYIRKTPVVTPLSRKL